ncbi:hypothetical protein D3C71_843260 [compost metagenome]
MHTLNGDVKKGVLGAWEVNSAIRAPFTDEVQTLALTVNAEIDRIVSERHWVWECEYAYREELARLKSVTAFPLRADRLAFFGPDFLEWILRTALKLWENGYIVREAKQN